MVRKFTMAAVSINLMFWLAASPNLANAAKDQSRVGGEDKPVPSSPFTSPTSPFSPADPDQQYYDQRGPADPLEILEPDDIPVVTSIELTIDIVQRALDALSEVRDKYNDQGIADYDTLEEFVSATEAGKRLEADIKSFGFTGVTQWNTAISSVGYAFSAVTDDEEDQIRQQISEIQIDNEIDADAKKAMIANLEAMIASANNKSIIRQLMQDEYYSTRLKLLEETE